MFYNIDSILRLREGDNEKTGKIITTSPAGILNQMKRIFFITPSIPAYTGHHQKNQYPAPKRGECMKPRQR